MAKFIKYSYVPLIISIIIFYLSCLIKPGDVPQISIEFFIPNDKIVHFLMYFGLSGATAINYIYIKKGNVKIYKLLIGAFLLPILYGGLIELLQYFYFSRRSGEWFDFYANILGSLAALPIAIVFKNHMIKKRVNNELV